LDKELDEAYEKNSPSIYRDEATFSQDVLIVNTSPIACAFAKRYMLEMVEARRNADKEERYDLFSGLLDAAQDGSDNGARWIELVWWRWPMCELEQFEFKRPTHPFITHIVVVSGVKDRPTIAEIGVVTWMSRMSRAGNHQRLGTKGINPHTHRLGVPCSP